jgi:hypothetical protein
MRASLSPFATLRSTIGLRSRRIDSADILPSIESMVAANHEPGADGIPQPPQESGVSTDGISRQFRLRFAVRHFLPGRCVPAVAASCKELDVVDDMLKHSAKLATGADQVNVIYCSNRRVRIHRRDLDAAIIALLNNYVAEHN